ALLKGYIINKFRGDPALFHDAERVITGRTGLESLGVVPHMAAARRLPAEDGVALDSAPAATPRVTSTIHIAVPRLPRIANFDDLDPLIAEADVTVTMVEPGTALPGNADLVLIPGSKSTLGDLAALRAEGWDIDIKAHVRRGGWVLGLCGAYQMLGARISDPHGIEGPAGEAQGLGLLDIETTLEPEKHLAEVAGTEVTSGAAVHGYEMHMGVSLGPDRARPMIDFGDHDDGARSADGRVLGCYLHGLFADDSFRHGFLARLADRGTSGVAYDHQVDQALDAIASGLEDCLDLDRLWEIADGP
ncbi:MAG: cobyric acid synthase, partial [Alphaproteobacteria bacterium]